MCASPTTSLLALLTTTALLFTPLTLADTFTDLPQCASPCFITAITNSACLPMDAYCQCTTGADQIRAATIACLCESSCTTTDLSQAQQVSNNICSSALAASSQTYAATTVGLEVCQATGGGGSGSGTTTTAGSAGASATGSLESASASVEAQSGNLAAPAATGGVGLRGAVMGMVGLGLMVL